MSVYQRKDTGAWYAKWREDGKQKTKNFGKDGEQEARDFDKLKNDQLSNNTYKIPTLIELADVYFEAKGDFLNEVTRKDIIRYILKGCKGFNNIPCNQITRRELQKFRTRLGSVKPVTKNKAQAYLNAIFTWGIKYQYISKNPWRGADKLPEEPFEVHSTIQDFRKIWAHASPYLQWAMEVSLNLALRPGKVELLNLQWTSFKWDEECVVLKQGKRVGTKTVYPSPEFLAKAKERYEQDQKNNIPWVIHKNGKHLDNIRSAWRIAKEKAGYKDNPIRFYDIRHIAATHMLNNGADASAVQHQLGHKRLSTTMDTYVSVVSGAQKKAATMLPKLDDE